MSAHCNTCGMDIVYPEGTWPLGTCTRCDMEADRDLWKQFALDTRGPLTEALELIAKIYRDPNAVSYGERLDVDQKLRSLIWRLDEQVGS